MSGISNGGDTIIVTVTDMNDNVLTALAGLQVYAPGRMALPDVTIRNLDESAQSFFTDFYNMDTSKPFTISVVEGGAWCYGGSSSVDYVNTNKSVSVGAIAPNYQDYDRTARIEVHGLDMLGDDVVAYFNITQEHDSVYECESISINGANVINNQGNEASYSIAFSPANTTQRTCSWSLRNATGKAELVNASTTDVTVRVLSGASGDSITLVAVNTDNLDVPEATKDITVTYNEEVHDIITDVTPSGAIQLLYNQESDNSVRVTFNRVVTSADVPITTDMTVITHAVLTQVDDTSTYILNVTSTQNTGTTQRNGWVDIYAYDPEVLDERATRIQFTQDPYTAPGNDIEILGGSDKPVINDGITRSTITFKARYVNNANVQNTFAQPHFNVTIYNGTTIVDSISDGILDDVPVAANSSSTQTYTRDLSQNIDTSTVTRITMTLTTASISGKTATYDSNNDN